MSDRERCFVKGTAADFTGKLQNTVYIERFNLTLRQRVSYLQRKSLGYCKNKSNFNAILFINLFDYNYRRTHKSLRLAVNSQQVSDFKKIPTSNPCDSDGINELDLELAIFVVSSLFS